MAEKKKKHGKKRLFGVNSVTVGACSNGGVPISANVTFPSNAESKQVFAAIVRASNGDPVSPTVPMIETTLNNYVLPSPGVLGAPSSSGLGPFKAKVSSTYKIKVDDPPLLSSQFPGCSSPSPMGAAGPDECCDQ